MELLFPAVRGCWNIKELIMSSSEPSKWTTALGASADVNVIPATTPAGTGLASMASIFPAITQVPIDSGGIAPERADF